MPITVPTEALDGEMEYAFLELVRETAAELQESERLRVRRTLPPFVLLRRIEDAVREATLALQRNDAPAFTRHTVIAAALIVMVRMRAQPDHEGDT